MSLKPILATIFSGILISSTSNADIKNGEKLFNDANSIYRDFVCLICDGTKGYAKNIEELTEHVNDWSMVEDGWFPSDIDDVVEYINRKYYHFNYPDKY